MKKLTVAAALMLCAAGASASNFRGADQVYLPVAGHLQGSSGTFISDVYISNLDDEEVKVSVIYQPFGPNLACGNDTCIGTEFKDVITLRPFERKEYKDFFNSALNLTTGYGQLIFNGCKSGTSCGPETQDVNGFSENFRPISVESRIYQITNQRPTETTGQLFSGFPWYHFVSELQATQGLDKVFITGITHTGTAGQTGTFRTNIGLVNASQYSTTTLVVKLYQGTQTEADKKAEAQVTLQPLGNVQPGIAQLFPGVTINGSNFFVTVEQRNSTAFGSNVPGTCDKGCPAFLAYGSVLDNISGDATTLEPQYMIELDPTAVDVIYPSSGGKVTMRRSARH